MAGARYIAPQYTEKQLRTTRVDKGEIYLTVTAKHATIADMQPTRRIQFEIWKEFVSEILPIAAF